jgi:alginate biosynthesis protein AlgX
MKVSHHQVLRRIVCCTALGFLPIAHAATNISACAKSSDIDGKGTSQFFDKNGWIFESWEYKDDNQFTASDSLTQLVLALKDRGSNLILVPTPFRTIKYASGVQSDNPIVANFSKSKYIKSWNDMLVATRATGATVIDLLPAVQNYKTSARGETFYYPRDHHWTTSGAEVAAQQVAAAIKQLRSKNSIPLQRETNSITFTSKTELVGSFGEHYATACGNRPPLMKRFDAKLSTGSSNLLTTSKTIVGVFGDSFGQAYPDNNFSPLLENATQLSTTNYSVSGGGPTVALAGYLADAKVRDQLPPFIVVPFQGWVSNNYFDYSQITAALVGCNASRMISTMSDSPTQSAVTFKPKDDPQSKNQRILHVTTSIPTNYFEVRGKYIDGSDLRFEIYRTSADYYKGSRTEFYAILPKAQAVDYATFKIEGSKSFKAKVELCNLESI